MAGLEGEACPADEYARYQRLVRSVVHPVSITRFPLTRFSPGSGLLRNRFVP